MPGLERIVEDGPEELAETAKAALARIENPVEKLKNAVLPDASPDDGARLLYRTIAQGRGAPDTVYGPIRLSSTLNGPNVRKTVAYWKDRNGKTVDIPFSSYGVNTFLVPFPRAGLKARPKHPTSTWFWWKHSTRSLTCSTAPLTARTGRYSTRRATIPACPILVEKRLQPFPIADLVRHVSIIKTTTHPLLTRRGPSYILYRAVRGRFMTSRLLRWKRSAPTDRQGR